MNITGVIVEYNPMHNGHLFHLSETKRLTECDGLVAVMSGNFVQRGEPAFVNKWVRTKMALLGGIDLVIELPLIYSISSAEGFAFGSISTLNSLGIINNICFGSESGDIHALNYIAQILAEEPVEYKKQLSKHLKTGISFPKARQYSLTDYIINNNYGNVNSNILGNIISNSNNILAIEYIKALIKLSSKIKPFALNRISNRYNSMELTGSISSATSIRNNYHDTNSVRECLPDYALELIENERINGRGPLYSSDFSDLILYKLRTSAENYIEELMDVDEGLHNRIKTASENAGSLTDLINLIKSKRYTATKIQRILIYALLDIKKDIQKKIKSQPDYIRVLGFNEKGSKLLRTIRESCNLPIITNPSNRDIDMLHYDLLATDIYVLKYSNSGFMHARQDLKIPPVIIK